MVSSQNSSFAILETIHPLPSTTLQLPHPQNSSMEDAEGEERGKGPLDAAACFDKKVAQRAKPVTSPSLFTCGVSTFLLKPEGKG